MGARSTIQKRIDKLQMELSNLHAQATDIFEAIDSREFAVQELQAVLKVLPEDEDSQNGPSEIALRKGSTVGKVRDVLRKVRTPVYVDDLLKQIGKPVEKKARVSLAGQLSFYVRKGQIFTKPEPNTFGLKEWEKADAGARAAFLANGPFEMKVPVADEDLDALPLPKNDPEEGEQAH